MFVDLLKAQSHCTVVSLPEEREVTISALTGLYDDYMR